MNLREQWEAHERAYLSPLAMKSADSRGRERPIPECEIRTVYQRDRDRILHAKSFRRLVRKTQVFLAPRGDHYRTRLTHTLEVAQVARTLARALRLNEDLTEAIALSHDLGHTPFGHIGEGTLNRLMSGGFRHYEQSLRVVEVLENDGQGLNLTWEVRDGIANHTGDSKPATLEAWCVKRSDRIAYLNHDIDDAIRGEIITAKDLPADIIQVLGSTPGERINTMVTDLIENTQKTGQVAMSNRVAEVSEALRDFMFEHVYRSGWRFEEEKRCDFILSTLFAYYGEHPEEMPEEYVRITQQDGIERGVCDFLASMTDSYSIDTFNELFVPNYFPVRS